MSSGTHELFTIGFLQELTVELASGTQVGSFSSSNAVPLLARTYLELGTWRWALYPGLDEDSMHGTVVFVFQAFLSSYNTQAFFHI